MPENTKPTVKPATEMDNWPATEMDNWELLQALTSRARTPWSASEDALLARMVREGRSPREIALLIGRSYYSVVTRARRTRTAA